MNKVLFFVGQLTELGTNDQVILATLWRLVWREQQSSGLNAFHALASHPYIWCAPPLGSLNHIAANNSLPAIIDYGAPRYCGNWPLAVLSLAWG